MRGAHRFSGQRGSRAAEAAAAFRRAVDEAKERHNITDLVARTRKVTRAGRERRALCAFHDERSPSMQLNDAKGTYYCFGCGEAGDIVTYVMKTERLGFIEALQWLGAADLPVADPAQRAKAVEEDAAERAAAIAHAHEIWERTVPADGTPAEVYLRQARGISAAIPASIRFGNVYAWRDKETGEVGPDLPALIGAVVDGNDELVGIQRIFLRDGGRAKAAMKKPKLSLGRVRGGALRLGPPAPEIIVCEGPEDGLSLAQELPGKSVWVALGTAMMPEMLLPDCVTSIVIASQNDAPGRAAAHAAGLALTERGLSVRTMYPGEGFKDWNDQLRGIRA